MTAIQRREPVVLASLTILLLLLSAIQPYDWFTWFLETLPVFIAAPLLLWSERHFPLTPLLCRLIFLHAIILIIGGHYTYAEVPAGFWVQDWFDLQRNHYDRLGHFMQGFEPAILAREILIRNTVIRHHHGGWLILFVLSLCLSFSACYELLEWLTAQMSGEAAEAFLGTQGDIWDTQWDMFMCLTGAILALLLLCGQHDRELARLPDKNRAR